MFSFMSRASSVILALPMFLFATKPASNKKDADKTTKKTVSAEEGRKLRKQNQKAVLTSGLETLWIVVGYNEVQEEINKIISLEENLQKLQKKAAELEAGKAKRDPKEPMTKQEQDDVNEVRGMLESVQQKLRLANEALRRALRDVQRSYQKALMEMPEGERKGCKRVELLFVGPDGLVIPCAYTEADKKVNQHKVEEVIRKTKLVFERLEQENKGEAA
jgi:hypothetical protein